MADPEPTLTFNDLMAATGRFVLYWSGFEQELRQSIIETRRALGDEAAPVRGGLKERLDLWFDLTMRLAGSAERADAARALRDQALHLRDLRNIIIHGVIGGHARPDDGEPAYITCTVGGFEAPTGEVRRITLEDLDHFTQAADACRRGCIDVGSFDYRL